VRTSKRNHGGVRKHSQPVGEERQHATLDVVAPRGHQRFAERRGRQRGESVLPTDRGWQQGDRDEVHRVAQRSRDPGHRGFEDDLARSLARPIGDVKTTAVDHLVAVGMEVLERRRQVALPQPEEPADHLVVVPVGGLLVV
jgi:hypothetical protein